MSEMIIGKFHQSQCTSVIKMLMSMPMVPSRALIMGVIMGVRAGTVMRVRMPWLGFVGGRKTVDKLDVHIVDDRTWMEL